MAKPVKYPKKLRQKLEKIEANAAMRREGLFPGTPGTDDPEFGKSFYQSFVPANSVAGMHAVIDDTMRTLEITMHMSSPSPASFVESLAPWERTEPEASP